MPTWHSIGIWVAGAAQSVASVLIVAAILVPVNDSGTAEDVTGGAKFMAPILALASAILFISTNYSALRHKREWIPRLFMSIGLLFSAYFWLADVSNTHPYSRLLIIDLGLTLLIIGGAAFLLFLLLMPVWLSNKSE